MKGGEPLPRSVLPLVPTLKGRAPPHGYAKDFKRGVT